MEWYSKGQMKWQIKVDSNKVMSEKRGHQMAHLALLLELSMVTELVLFTMRVGVLRLGKDGITGKKSIRLKNKFCLTLLLKSKKFDYLHNSRDSSAKALHS